MKRALLLVLVATLGANCASRTTSQANRNAIQIVPSPPALPTTESAKRATADSREDASPEQKREVPAEFRGVDFKNFTYPASYGKGGVPLKDGNYERAAGAGGDTFKFEDVSFVDLTGDAKREAVVSLNWVSCGVSCDGGTNLFYVYSSRKNKPALFWRVESGSTGYGCGLKSLAVDGRKINLELFNKCRFKGVTPVREHYSDDEVGKYIAKAYTRFLFESDGKKVFLKARKIFPFPQGDIGNHHAVIKISND